MVTKVFRNGNSIALRIPKAWGFSPGDVVELLPEEGGLKVLRRSGGFASLLEICRQLPDDFLPEGRPEQGPIEERDWNPRN